LPISEAGAIVYAGGTKIVDVIASYAKPRLEVYNVKLRVNGHRILFDLPPNLNI